MCLFFKCLRKVNSSHRHERRSGRSDAELRIMDQNRALAADPQSNYASSCKDSAGFSAAFVLRLSFFHKYARGMTAYPAMQKSGKELPQHCLDFIDIVSTLSGGCAEDGQSVESTVAICRRVFLLQRLCHEYVVVSFRHASLAVACCVVHDRRYGCWSVAEE